MNQLPGINLLYTQYSIYREKRDEYYLRHSDIKNYDHFYKRVFGSNENIKYSFNAPKRIKPFGLNFGLTKEEVVGELGRPDFVLVRTGLDHHQIIFYKKRISGHSYMLQVHFVKNKMVYAMNRIVDVSANKKDFFLKVTKMMLSKYSISGCNDIKETDTVVSDEYNNKVIVTEALGLSIRYISGSNDFCDFLESRVEYKKNRSENSETANLDKLFVHI